MNINDWKIGTRIWAGYAAVILVTVAFAGFAFTQLGVIDVSSKRIT